MLGGNLDSEEIEALEIGDSGSSPAFTCELLCIWGELLNLSEPVSPSGKKGKRMHDHTRVFPALVSCKLYFAQGLKTGCKEVPGQGCLASPEGGLARSPSL